MGLMTEVRKGSATMKKLLRRWAILCAFEGKNIGAYYSKIGRANAAEMVHAAFVALRIYSPPSLEALERQYQRECARLSRRFPRAVERTEFEKAILETLRKSTRLSIQTSCWVGPGCFDFYIPAIASPYGISSKERSAGLIIESDGPIHSDQRKMIKDDWKHIFVSKYLGIPVSTILNEHYKQAFTEKMLNSLKDCRRLDSRALRVVKRRVYWATILAWSPSCEIEELCGMDISVIENLVIEIDKGIPQWAKE